MQDVFERVKSNCNSRNSKMGQYRIHCLTHRDLSERVRGWPLQKIGLFDLGLTRKQVTEAEKITLTIGGKTKVLKSR